ncbi:MAG TPA: hypothetical protein VKP69_05500 [Isosphaeraceae bacterium]|nr:hypothetical protein [Isosphaeraceae bacterium]
MRRPWDTTVESRPRVPPGVHRERGDDPEPTTGHAAGAPTTGAPDPGAVPRDEWPSIAVRSPRDGLASFGAGASGGWGCSRNPGRCGQDAAAGSFGDDREAARGLRDQKGRAS